MRTKCPVSDCDYEGPPESVAAHVRSKRDSKHDWDRLGYKGGNHYEREHQNKSDDETKIGWLTDSHIGKSEVKRGKRRWDISPLKDLTAVVQILSSFDLDGVIYTGDLFHEDKNGIRGEDVKSVKYLLESYLDDALPIRYIKGNHARNRGKEIWSDFEREGIVEPLEIEPYELGEAAIYGIDHHQGDNGWWDEPPKLQPTDAEHRILCLHQAVKPVRTHERAIDLKEVLPKLSRFLEGVPEVVLIGHIHEKADTTIEVDGQKVVVLSYGATTRVGDSCDDFPPSAGLIIPDLHSPEIRYLYSN